jgi:hypothetical protein
MKILVALCYEEGDPQHGSADPHEVTLQFVDGSTVKLSNTQGQAHVDVKAFGVKQ